MTDHSDRNKCGHRNIFCSFTHCEYEPKPPPRVTVSGNGISVFRLDEQGNPVGEGLHLDSAVSLHLSPDSVDAGIFKALDMKRKTFTIDMDMKDISPEVLAVLTGGLMPFPWWYRRLPRFLRRRIKTRWIRRGYGG